MTNPICPHCGGKTHKSGVSVSGKAAFRCACCGKRFTGNPTGRPKSPTAMTAAERKRKERQKKKEQNNT